jgi:periplasmic divalent cation tolerance protein
MKDQYFIVLCTAPDEPTARELARILVGEQLAACVNCLGGVSSTYVWEGKVCEETEVLMIIKTSAGRLATLSARIEALHPYEVPEVVALAVGGGSERYLEWLGQTVGGP